jgi:heptosyltransferase I
MNALSKRKSLFIRLDRIGDSIVTLPVDQVPELESHEIEWVLPLNLRFLTHFLEKKRKIHFVDTENESTRENELAATIKNVKPDSLVFFQGPDWSLKVISSSQIATRVGPYSKLRTYLAFNKGVRQKRSRSDRHELKYNLELVEKGLNLNPLSDEEFKSLRLSLKVDQRVLSEVLQKFTLSPNYIIVHPGMRGSAQNWPTDKWVEFILLARQQSRIIVTGTLQDAKWTEPIKKQFENAANVRFLDGKIEAEDLIPLLSGAAAVVAPSTGVLHLAASLGVPTFGIYSPVQVQSPMRWGPLGERAVALSPLDFELSSCPGKLECLMQKCPSFDCMKRIDPKKLMMLLNSSNLV